MPDRSHSVLKLSCPVQMFCDTSDRCALSCSVWDLVRQCERLKDGGQDPDRLVRRLEAIWEYLAQVSRSVEGPLQVQGV